MNENEQVVDCNNVQGLEEMNTELVDDEIDDRQVALAADEHGDTDSSNDSVGTKKECDAVAPTDLVVEAPAIMEEEGGAVTPADLAVEAPMIMEEDEEIIGCTSAFDTN